MAILCCLIVPIAIASSSFKCQASVDPGLCNGGPQISGKNAASKMQKNFGQLKLHLCMDRISLGSSFRITALQQIHRLPQLSLKL